jgi:hypothetical protein
MFTKINNGNEIKTILDGLPNDIIESIRQPNPIIGILKLSCYFKRGGKSPIPSVVSSKLIGMEFYFWENYSDQINKLIMNPAIFGENDDFEERKERLIKILKNEKLLFCFTEALFIESQMKVFSRSPYPVQEVVKTLSAPIFENKNIIDNNEFPIPNKFYNAQIYCTLHLGKTPFVQVNFPYTTIQNWMNELEAGIALTIPQLINESIKTLKEPESFLLKEIIRDELYSWDENKPKIGDIRNWSWLPSFGKSQDKIDRDKNTNIDLKNSTKLLDLKSGVEKYETIENARVTTETYRKGFNPPNICAWCGGKPDKVKNVYASTKKITAYYVVATKYKTSLYNLNLPICNSCDVKIDKRKKMEGKGCSFTLWLSLFIPIIFISLLILDNGVYDSIMIEISLAFGGLLMFLGYIFHGFISSVICFIMSYPKESDWGWIDDKENVHFKNAEFSSEFYKTKY